MPQEVDPTGADEKDPEGAPEQGKPDPVYQVIVTTDEQGFPKGVTPVGVPVTSLPAILRMAAKMVDQHLEL